MSVVHDTTLTQKQHDGETAEWQASLNLECAEWGIKHSTIARIEEADIDHGGMPGFLDGSTRPPLGQHSSISLCSPLV
jgi:hypothetical protein